MAIKVKGVDRSASLYSRVAKWSSTAGDFASGDTLDIGTSLSGPAGNTQVIVAGGGDCVIRINSLNRRYPLDEDAKRYGYWALDLSNEEIWFNADALEYSLTAGQTLEIDDMPVSSIEFTDLTNGVEVIARS